MARTSQWLRVRDTSCGQLKRLMKKKLDLIVGNISYVFYFYASSYEKKKDYWGSRGRGKGIKSKDKVIK